MSEEKNRKYLNGETFTDEEIRKQVQAMQYLKLSRNKEIIIERLIELAQEEKEENDRRDSDD